MDSTPDYSKCSQRELHDVAARIDKAKYPDRYALVTSEIERRETLGDETATAAVRKPFTQHKRVIALAFVGGALVGMMICSVNFPVDVPNDSYVPSIAEMIALAIGFFGGGIACAQWRLRTIERS